MPSAAKSRGATIVTCTLHEVVLLRHFCQFRPPDDLTMNSEKQFVDAGLSVTPATWLLCRR